MANPTKPKLTAALRKALERAGAWDSLPEDERTRATKKKWLAKQAKAQAAEAKKAAATKKPKAKKKAATKSAAKKKAPPRRRRI